MIKVMVCDDEGIVRQSLRFILDKAFGEECQTEEAKSGRAAIELVQTFRPDIVFMDIQMPGINGIDAMKELKAENPNIQFIVLTAYDQFGYAKEAIDLGVLEYLTKPIGRDKIIEVMQRAISLIQAQRSKKSYELEVQEKLETVIPMIENGYIYNIILQDADYEDTGYEALLNIQGKYGFIIVFEFGEERRDGNLTNPVGSNMKMQRCYTEFREIAKEYYDAIIGSPMSNKIIICVPTEKNGYEYDERVQLIEKTRGVIRILEQKLDLKFKAGIGSVKTLEQVVESYHEATAAIQHNDGKVMHIKDISVGCKYDKKYPSETEEALFDALGRGDVELLKHQGIKFVEWLENQSSVVDNNARLKLMEFVLRAEEMAYRQGGMIYQYESRTGFLEEVLKCENYNQLQVWFLHKMITACHNMKEKQKEKNTGIIEQAKIYVKEHFANELSLDEISREINLSPYYFSKLFKEESGENYIEYVTKIRMEHAKDLLKNPENSIKYVCVEVGYSDPNYFSRIFKKWIGKTPSEYREEVGGRE